MYVKKQRQSNIELLRIVLILMIISLHYFYGGMGGLLAHVKEGSLNYYVSHFFESLCIISVNVFILITGYFSVNKTKINISKVIHLCLIMIFWGVILSFLNLWWLNPQPLTLNSLVTIINLSLTQWFVVIYCILYLIIPYINIVINNISRQQFKILLIILTIFFYVIPTISKVTLSDNGYGIINFLCLYLFGAYIRKFYDHNIPLIQSLFVYLGATIITTCFSFIATHAWSYSTIFNLVGSISFFEIFKSLKIEHNNIINRLATYTFSVYLIDVDLAFFLYRKLFHSNQYWNSSYMILNLVLSTLAIYIICVILDFVRGKCLGKVFDYLSDKFNYYIDLGN